MNDSQRRSTLKGDTVTRTYKIIRFDPHLRRKALLIRGEITVQIADSLCRQIIAEETKGFRKVIRLENINESSDVSSVMDEVMEKCPFIEDDQLIYLSQVIEVIKKRKYNENSLTYQTGRNSSTDDSTTPSFPDYFEDDENLNGIDSDVDLRDITMESLEYYVELLYEQIPDRVKGARCIAKLAGTTENLTEIYEHESALNALFRTLREDYKKSMELTTNILTISMSFAIYRNFHPVFITNKICSLLLDIIEYELIRFDKWVDEIHYRKDLAHGPQGTAKMTAEYERMKKTFTGLTTRQDVLLSSGFNVIRLLTECPAFMKEIANRGIVKLLSNCLERKSTDLLITVISFLKVMSAFKEANIQLAAMEIIDRMHKLVDENSPKALLAPIFGLLFNLSFNTKLRQKMLKYDLLKKTASFLHDDDLQSLCIPLLHNFSMDERIRPKFAGTGAIASIFQQLATMPPGSPGIPVRALTLNLASSKRCSQIMCNNGGLQMLLRLAFQYEDNLLMKIIRKISEHEGPSKSIFVDLICDIAGAILNAPSQEFAIECIGTLGNLTIPDLDFKKLLQTYELVPWMKSKLRVSSGRQSIPGERSLAETAQIEVTIFIGTCAGDSECACYLIEEDLLESLLSICEKKNVDPDLIVQILFTFYKFCSNEGPRAHIAQHTDIPDLVTHFLRNDSIAIREMAEAVLNTFTQLTGELNGEWTNRVKMEKFKSFNRAWIDEISRPAGECTANLFTPYQKQQLERFYPQPEFHEDELLEHPDSGRSKTSSSTSDTLTLSETETEDETEDEEDPVEHENEPPELLVQGISAHSSKSIFDRFEHQFRQERQLHEGYEYGISEEDDEDLLNGSGSLDEFDRRIGTVVSGLQEKENLLRRNKSAKNSISNGESLSRDYPRLKENGLSPRNKSKTEDNNPSVRKSATKQVMSVEIKRKS